MDNSLLISTAAVVISAVSCLFAFFQARAAKKSNKIACEARKTAIEANGLAKDANKISADANMLSERALAVSQDQTVNQFAFRLDKEISAIVVTNKSAAPANKLMVVVRIGDQTIANCGENNLPPFGEVALDGQSVLKKIAEDQASIDRINSQQGFFFVGTGKVQGEIFLRWYSELGVLHTDFIQQTFN
ncbi:hypothetical protein KRX54_01095 [Actinomycetaceae bacterium TAE3-ERU4]|nr:hypothetical protein [Actinomycetaceae bacterium TAE3-ERU4]